MNELETLFEIRLVHRFNFGFDEVFDRFHVMVGFPLDIFYRLRILNGELACDSTKRIANVIG